MPVTVRCSACGLSLSRRPSQAKSGNYFCSRSCRSAWMKRTPERWIPVVTGSDNPSWSGGMIVKQCDSCGVDVERYPSQFERNDHVFCSSVCQGKWIKEHEAKQHHHNWKGHTITCAYCGAIHQRSPSLIKGERQFCDNQCRGSWLSEHGKLARKKDANHDEIAGGLRAAGYKVIDTHLVGDGFPDIVVVGGGVYLFEIKNPNTSHGMTPAQVRWHSEWKGQVTVIESLDEALAVMGRSHPAAASSQRPNRSLSTCGTGK